MADANSDESDPILIKDGALEIMDAIGETEEMESVPRQPKATSALCDTHADAGEEFDASEKEVVELRVDAHATDEIEDAVESKETVEVQMADTRLVVDLFTLDSAEEMKNEVNNTLAVAFEETVAVQMSAVPTVVDLATLRSADETGVAVDLEANANHKSVAEIRADLLRKAKAVKDIPKRLYDVVLETPKHESVAQLIVDACGVDNLPLAVADAIASFTPPFICHPLAGCTFWLLPYTCRSSVPSSFLLPLYGFPKATPTTTVINYIPVFWYLRVICMTLIWLTFVALPFTFDRTLEKTILWVFVGGMLIFMVDVICRESIPSLVFEHTNKRLVTNFAPLYLCSKHCCFSSKFTLQQAFTENLRTNGRVWVTRNSAHCLWGKGEGDTHRYPVVNCLVRGICLSIWSESELY